MALLDETRGLGVSCAYAGEAAATHTSTPTQHHERFPIIVVLFLLACRAPRARARRYTGRTVKFTFCVTDLPEALSVILISSR